MTAPSNTVDVALVALAALRECTGGQARGVRLNFITEIVNVGH